MRHKRCTLKKLSKVMMAFTCVLLLAGAVGADTLELKDGRVLQGRFLGGTQAIMRFEWNGDVRTFSVNDIVALTFTNAYHEQTDAPPAAQAPDNAGPPPSQDNGSATSASPPPPDDSTNYSTNGNSSGNGSA